MIEYNSHEHIFKFVSLRPASPTKPAADWTIPLTDEMKRVIRAEPQHRAELVEELMDVQADPRQMESITEVEAAASEAPDLRTFRERLLNADTDSMERDLDRLWDATFSRYWSGAEAPDGPSTGEIERALTLRYLATADLADEVLDMPMGVARRRTPSMITQRQEEEEPGDDLADRKLPDVDAQQVRLTRVVSELSALQEAPSLLVGADEEDGKGTRRTAGSLDERGIESLSAATRETLQSFDLSLDAPVHELIADVEAIGQAMAAAPKTRENAIPTRRGRVRPAGLADLLVVKQHIKRYQPSEIAHIENVMAGERRSRVHRTLDVTALTYPQGRRGG